MTLRIFCLRLPLLFLACAPYMPMAHATERVGDATYLYDLEQYARTVSALEQTFLAAIDAATPDERFSLYWTYNHLTGAWIPVDYLRSLLQRSVAARSYLDDNEARTAVRDQAEFVLAELDHAVAELAPNNPGSERRYASRIDEGLRSLLSDIRTTVHRILADQCSRLPCVARD